MVEAISYWTLIRMDGFEDARMLRVKMVKHWQQYRNISKTARDFNTSRHTVRKWVNRWRKDGWEGLKDKRNGPDNIPHKIPESPEEKIIDLRDKTEWGPWRLKQRFDLPCSLEPIRRVLKENEKTKKRPKWKQRRNLRKQKRRLKAFELMQVDVKELGDQSGYGLLVEGGFPGFEYTV